MKNYEKESFFKIFLIFFIILAIFSSFVLYLYYKEEVEALNKNLLLQIKEYNFNFKGSKYSATIVKKRKSQKIDYLYITKKEVYVLFNISKKNKNILKIIYPIKKYNKDIFNIKFKIALLYLSVLSILLIFSIFYALYAIKPMKKAIFLIEDFLKDVIHDINTPITTILLNTKYLMKKDPCDELERIEVSADRILSLYKNFEIEIKGFHPEKNNFDVYLLIEQRAEYFKKLYPSFKWQIRGNNFIYNSDKDAFTRIIDNILSNSCKYNNDKNPMIKIDIKNSTINIKDNGIGIKDSSKVFDRFYKENERGLGIGMNIVKKLCDELNIKIVVNSKINQGTVVKLTLN